MKARQIASQLGLHEEYVRQLIRHFNRQGSEGIRAKGWPPRPGKLTEEEKSVIAEVATAPPQAFGHPFNQWSLRKLHQLLVLEKKMTTAVSYATIRRRYPQRQRIYLVLDNFSSHKRKEVLARYNTRHSEFEAGDEDEHASRATLDRRSARVRMACKPPCVVGDRTVLSVALPNGRVPGAKRTGDESYSARVAMTARGIKNALQYTQMRDAINRGELGETSKILAPRRVRARRS